MHRSAIISVSAALATMIISGPGCGPSLRRTEQSDNAFLRCFDGDYHPGRAAAEKGACWSAWLERRVYNQPADKVAYAELRLDELAAGISVPGPPGPAGAFHERPVASALESAPETGDADGGSAGPAAGSADAGIDAAGDGGVGVDGPLPPGDRCARACRRAFEVCGARCGDGAGPECRAACEDGYTSCMRSCFE
jgi:hypothetical protein